MRYTLHYAFTQLDACDLLVFFWPIDSYRLWFSSLQRNRALWRAFSSLADMFALAYYIPLLFFMKPLDLYYTSFANYREIDNTNPQILTGFPLFSNTFPQFLRC